MGDASPTAHGRHDWRIADWSHRGEAFDARGWAAHVFERVPGVLSGRGAGIGTHPEFFDVLRAAHLPDGPDIGVYVTIRRMLAKDGRVTLEHRYPQVLAHWDSVYSLLLGSIDRNFYQLGKRMMEFAKKQGAVSVRFEDGDTFDADLLIGADGIRSSVRSVIFPDITPLCCVAGNGSGRALLVLRASLHAGLFLHLPSGWRTDGGLSRPARKGRTCWLRA